MVKHHNKILDEKLRKHILIQVLSILFVISLILAIYISYKYNLADQKLASLYSMSNKYSVLQSNFTHLRSQLSNLTVAHSMLESKYEQLDYNYSTLKSEYENKTKPNIEMIYSNKTVLVPDSYYNYLTGSFTNPVYNLSFYAPYNGSLIINFSGNPTLDVAVSQGKPTFKNGDFTGYAANQYYVLTTVGGWPYYKNFAQFPISKGINYISFINDEVTAGNFNTTNITVTFSAKYIRYNT